MAMNIPPNTWMVALKRLSRNKLAMLCALLLLVTVVACYGAGLSPYGYAEQNLALGATAPSLQHWLGTDVLGRDNLTRILYGGQLSLAVAFASTSVALFIGISWGGIAGYAGGRTDIIMMRIVDSLYALPFMILIILLMVVFGRNLLLMFLAIGAVEWLTMARIVRAQVMMIKQQDYVLAAELLGLPTSTILTRHILPNIIGPVIIYTTLTIPQVILLESFLSFLGLGVQPPQSSWGVLVANGVETMEQYPWLLIAPAGVLSLVLFAFNFLGDGLRDALDPKSTSNTTHDPITTGPAV